MTRARARALDRARYVASDLARDLGSNLDRVRALDADLARERDGALDRAFNLVGLLARASDVDLAQDIALFASRDVVGGLVDDLGHVRNVVRDRRLTSVRDIVRDRRLTSVRDFVRACGLIRDLDLYRDAAIELVKALEAALITTQGSLVAVGSKVERRGSMSRHLVQRAVWCLPRVHQHRYREEFEAELAEIAATGRRWQQWGYGVRVVGRAMMLRRALRTPVAQQERSW